ncbi:hypothetical protein [Sulfurimonas sp.]
MKSIILIILAMFVSSGCTSHTDKGYYKRANKASEKALHNLDKE